VHHSLSRSTVLLVAVVLVLAALLASCGSSSSSSSRRAAGTGTRSGAVGKGSSSPETPGFTQVPGTPGPSLPAAPPGTVAMQFVRSWLACVYHRASCRRIVGLYPAYAHLVEPELANSPATHADRSIRLHIVSIRLIYNCPLEVVAVSTYNQGPGTPDLQLHPNLVREAKSWQVFDVPEFPAHIPLPRPLTGGVHVC
jgi:hypothetical protein